MRHTFKYFLSLLALCATNAGYAAPAEPRFNSPITPANWVLFDFGYGKIMRLPKLLFNPSLIPKDPRTPMHAQAIGMIFLLSRYGAFGLGVRDGQYIS